MLVVTVRQLQVHAAFIHFQYMDIANIRWQIIFFCTGLNTITITLALRYIDGVTEDYAFQWRRIGTGDPGTVLLLRLALYSAQCLL